MKQFIIPSSQIFLAARQKDSRGVRRFICTAVIKCAFLALVLLSGIGLAQAQQPDPLTISKDGNVGIGTTAPTNKLSVTGNADFAGAVGIGTSNLGTSRFRIANSPSDFAHFRFGAAGAGEFEVVGSANGWTINSKTSGKHLYFNRDAEMNSDVLIGRSGSEMFVKGRNGYVGLGIAAPIARLDVAGSGWFRNDQNALPEAAGKGVRVFFDVNDSGQIFSYDYTTSKPKNLLLQSPGGNVGIGTTNPSKAKLEVSGFFNHKTLKYGFLRNPYSDDDREGKKDVVGKYNVPGPDAIDLPYSIWADRRVAAEEFNAFSDERLKNIQGRSDSVMDLRTLLSLEITDYRHKDVIAKGHGTYKKVTGQQVEKVFPQAVSKHTEVVPDIYRQASIEDGWITLATNLKKGERVRLISEKTAGVYEVLEVAQNRFRTDFKPEGNRIFVYGREVKDFLTVDYEAISMLNVSATQQIKKEKDEEVKALQDENAMLRGQLAEQGKRLSELEARDKARDEKLAAIEALLVFGNQPAARNLSLKKAN